ncbi:MAG: hypothetical protein ACXVCY_02860 [Pseudobdellovibrionaceae bacterium]
MNFLNLTKNALLLTSLFFSFLVNAQASSETTKHVDLEDGTYRTPSQYCDYVVQKNTESHELILVGTNDYQGCSYPGEIIKFAKTDYGYAWKDEQKMTLKDIFDCTGKDSKNRPCLDQFYDKEGKLLLKVGNVLRTFIKIEVITPNSFVSQNTEHSVEWLRDGKHIGYAGNKGEFDEKNPVKELFYQLF